jgi:hypothetical protein
LRVLVFRRYSGRLPVDLDDLMFADPERPGEPDGLRPFFAYGVPLLLVDGYALPVIVRCYIEPHGRGLARAVGILSVLPRAAGAQAKPAAVPGSMRRAKDERGRHLTHRGWLYLGKLAQADTE